MKKKPGVFFKGEFPVIFAILCAMLLRLAFYPESRTPIALYGTIGGVVLFIITTFFSWRAAKRESSQEQSGRS